MSKPLTVTIPHRLGKDEAVRRLKSGLGAVRSNWGHVFAIQEETWTGDRLQFQVSALGQSASGSIDVRETTSTWSCFCRGFWRSSLRQSNRSCTRKAR
jgi:Putative polyhydroxyalkanoic acid system protein (PHA_gran_rgn)